MADDGLELISGVEDGSVGGIQYTFAVVVILSHLVHCLGDFLYRVAGQVWTLLGHPHRFHIKSGLRSVSLLLPPAAGLVDPLNQALRHRL